MMAYNCVYFHEESQNEQNAVEHIDYGPDPSINEIDSVNLTASEIASDDNSDSIISSQTEAQADVGSITSESNEENNTSEEQMYFADENEKAQYVRAAIEAWAREPGRLSKRKLDDLLSKLHPAFPNLPLSYKTLLQTPGINLIPVNGGKLCSPIRFWPILGRLVRTKNEPFIIALFKGRIDPSVKDFLKPFVKEVAHLLQNGYTNNDIAYKFSIRHYILDAPARAKVKCCIEHGGYCACEKCEVVGEWIDHRMTYIKLDETLRTDESFRNQEQPYHHLDRSPLLDIETLLVSQFRLDALHLIDLGVFKRFLLALLKWNGPWKLHRDIVTAISHKLEMLKDSCPSDFNRPPRSFQDFTY
ncbi:Uncharacterized protein DBV15_12177 [Temnothorax longispinosus]|uniref:Tpa: transposase domain-containing protein n=1 Tax=Temnothorax longispinosus TaxID=300112 RepID=A0A4S2KZA3_9HYME|nr:Uncharacterized protein DBV15_12177 [Temnothorax longispinosus]